MKRFEAVLWAVVGTIVLAEFIHNGAVFSLVQAAGFELVSIASFFSKTEPAKALEKITWAGLFRSPDKPWVRACEIMGGLLIVAGLSGAAFGS